MANYLNRPSIFEIALHMRMETMVKLRRKKTDLMKLIKPCQKMKRGLFSVIQYLHTSSMTMQIKQEVPLNIFQTKKMVTAMQ